MKLITLWPLSMLGARIKALLWISVGCSFLDMLLFLGGDGRRLPDLILGTRIIQARMKGAGSTDGWQFASPADLTIRMAIICSFFYHEWYHTGIITTILMLMPYVLFFVGRAAKSLEFLWEDPTRALSHDEKQRRLREQQQVEVARKAAEGGGSAQAGSNATPSQGLNLAGRNVCVV